MNKKIIYSMILIVFITTISLVAFCDDSNYDDGLINEKGLILSAETFEKEDSLTQGYQKVKLKILTGEYKDEIVEIENMLPKNIAYRIEVEEGDLVVLAMEEIEGERQIYIADFSRNGVLKILVVIFLLLLIIIGKSKGVKSVVTISLTMFLIFKVLIPGILKGYNPLYLSIIIASIITILTIIIVSGFTKKSYAAIIGTIIGVIIAAIVSIIVGNTITITGMMPDEAGMILYLPQNIKFNFNDLLFSGILLGALGAVMDVAMSIASSIQEIHSANNKLTKCELFKSGMSVGHDIMGTMSNTLILAYTGSSIPLLLILNSYGRDFSSIVNMDIVATEVVRSLAGSIGLVITIPVTAIVTILFIKNKIEITD